MPSDRRDSEEQENARLTEPRSEGEERTPQSPEFAAGYMLGGKYKIIKLLGVGASGTVYEAEHREIGRRVAIKVVHRELAERGDIIERFRTEARVCGRIRNRYVGQVFDVGQTRGGSPYMVMELHEGGSLAKLLEKGPLPLPTAVEICRELLSALKAAQEFGVVHRDVKPDNLIVTKDVTGETIVKLVDFGISKPIAADVSQRNVTQEGTVVGSPNYMSPEQLRSSDVDYRTDLYAAGVVLYEMVTGHMPFNADSLTELMAAILRDPVTPPARLRADCPVELEKIILRAMSRGKADRFQTAEEMERALAQVAASYQYPTGAAVWELEKGEPAAKAGVSAADKSSDKAGYVIETNLGGTMNMRIPMARRWPLLALGAAAAAALGLFFALRGGAPHQSRAPQSPASKNIAVIPGRAPAIDLYEPTQPPATAPNPARAAADRPSRKTAAKKGEGSGAKALGERPAGAAIAAASREPLKPRVAESVPAESRTEKLSQTASEPASQESAADLISQASAAYVRGQVPLARASYAKAVELAPRNAAAWRGLGMASSRMGQRQDAARAFKRYLELAPAAPDADDIRRKLEQLQQ